MDCSQEHIGSSGMLSVRKVDKCIKPPAEIRLPRRKIVNGPLRFATKVNQPIVAVR
ncbi:MAG: hypothetical protein M0Z77_07315 [Thermoplasmatales archaeon]|nr:hypothetical protein [Thermoplasmatales archaeon]